MSRRSSLILWAAIGMVFTGGPTAFAETYPARPVKVIVPFAAGGPLDLLVRALGDKLATRLKQPFIVENRPGAGGNIGTEAAAKANPDGYTLLAVLSGTLTANPALYGKLPFNPETDFQPISLLTTTSQMLVVHPSVPVHSVTEFVALAKREPIAYAHAGPGSGGHLAMEYFRLMAGFEAVQVPYRGNAPLVIDLVAGQVKAGFVASAGVIPHVREHRLRGLAISSAKRSPLVPDVPTIAEAGYPNLKLNTYFVLLAPAKTPDSVIVLIEREIKSALQSAELQDKFRAHEIEPLGTTPAEAKTLLRAETELWADIVRKGNLRLN